VAGRRVVITGLGAVTPLGHDVETLWHNLRQGTSGVDQIPEYEAQGFATSIGARVRGFDGKAEAIFPELTSRYPLAPGTRFALHASHQAMQDAGLVPGQVSPERLGIYLGSGEGSFDWHSFAANCDRSWNNQNKSIDVGMFLRDGTEHFNPSFEMEQEPNFPGAHLAELYEARGPNCNCLTACAASSQALGEAARLLRGGDADVMISGGCHSMLHPLGVMGFVLLTALSKEHEHPTRASRPFDAGRNGFVIGEGAGILVLEELEHARRRGAHIYGELVGYGNHGDAFRITDTHPEGRGATLAMKSAMQDARVTPEDLDYINAHGTSTVVNDKVESLAIRQALGAERAYQVPVSSIKSMLGHLIAAAGAIEIITCLMAIRDGVVPPTINYETPDPACDLDYVPNEARELPVDVAASNSFGFGGQNVTLIVRRLQE
jgi:3-oxoacyl-[acyl-carrier-protein] synthase II